MRSVFISSVVSGFESYRLAAREACDITGDRAVMSESFGARAYSSEVACATEVEQSDVYVLIVGERYGFETASGRSVTEQEFDTAVAAKKPILAFIQDVEMEPKQQRFRQRVEDYHDGFFRAGFKSEGELSKQIIRGLIQLNQTRSAITEQDFIQRIAKSDPTSSRYYRNQDEPSISLAYLPQPARRVALKDTPEDLDQLFSTLAQVGLCKLSGGYENKSGEDFRSIVAGELRYSSFEDGFELIQAGLSNPVRSDNMSPFGSMIIDPARLKLLAHGAVSLIQGGGWFSLELQNMQNRWLGEPAKSFGGGMIVAQHAQPSNAIRELLIPAPKERLEAWVEDALRRFTRIFGPKQSGR